MHNQPLLPPSLAITVKARFPNEFGLPKAGAVILCLSLEAPGPSKKKEKKTCYIWEGKGGIKTAYAHGKGERSTPYIIGRHRNYPLTLWSSRIFIVFALFFFFLFFLPLWHRLQSMVRAAPGTVRRNTAHSPHLSSPQEFV